MLTTPTTTTIQYSSPTDEVFKTEMTSSQSPSDGFVGLPPPPPPPPAPPVFNSNTTTNNSCKIFLPHQEVDLVVNRENMSEIQARSIPTMLMAGNNIWTRRVLPNLRIKQTVFDQHFAESKSTMTGHYRRSSLTTSFIAGTGAGGGGGLGGMNDDGPLSFVLLDATSKMLYDVPMRHLLQLVKKDHDDDASIDHVIRAIDETHMKSEWLDAVIALNKQFDKRPEDKARVLAHKGSTHGLVLIEQFFVKLVRVPAYEFKLIYLKFREEAPAQLERMNKHINDLLESVEIILNNEQLPGILHLLCLLYNSITGKTIPGLHFDSILSVLSTRTPRQNTTIAHVLCQTLEEQYPHLLNIFDDSTFLKLKDLAAIKFIPIFVDLRLLNTRYKQLNTNLREFEQQLIILPEHIQSTLADLQNIFTKLLDDENRMKKCEKDLANYFCVWDLSVENCLSTLGQFLDKLRLAHMQNVEQRRRNDLILKQRSAENRLLQTPTTARLLRNAQNQYGSDTNIFRDHLNVPLTPTSIRQRSKVNKIISRERFYGSSRDISYTNDEQQESMESNSSSSSSSSSSTTNKRTQNLLSNAIPRKRGHSPTIRTALTKRPFNALPICATTPSSPTTTHQQQQDQQSDDVFISSNDEQDDEHDTKMDCSTSEETNLVEKNNLNDDHILPTNESVNTRVISVCEVQPSFYLTTPIRRLFDQSTPSDSIPSIDFKHPSSSTPSLNDFQHLEYSDGEDENNKENARYSSTLSPLISSENVQTNELSSVANPIDEDSQPSSSLSLPVNISNDTNRSLPTIPLLLSDSETLDEGFETQSNVSETIEPTPRSCPIETNETISTSVEETLANELTQRLTFITTRRLSHDSSLHHHKKLMSPSNDRPRGLLRTSTSAYSYPTFTAIGQRQNSLNDTFTKRTPSAESLRLTSNNTNNNNATLIMRSSRHIQRCAVSRRIWNEKDTDDPSKSLTTSPPPPSSSTVPPEPDDASSASTITTTPTTTTTNNNRRSITTKPKSKIHNLHTVSDNASRSNPPNIRKVSPRLGHASSCQNVSNTTSNSPKSSPLVKTRSPPSFFLNSNQIHRSTFTRSSEKPLRALHMSTTMTNERSSPKTTRPLYSSTTDLNSSLTSTVKTTRKPPSSWHHHQKSLANKSTTVHSTNLTTNRKASSSANDLRKSHTLSNPTFQRLTQSKRL